MLLQTLAFRSFTSMTLNKLVYNKRAEEGKERAWCLLSADEKRWDGERPSQMRREGSSAVDQSLIKNIKLFISFQAAWTKLKCLRTESIHRRLSISVIHEMLSLCVTVFREAHGHVDNKNWPGINDFLTSAEFRLYLTQILFWYELQESHWIWYDQIRTKFGFCFNNKYALMYILNIRTTEWNTNFMSNKIKRIRVEIWNWALYILARKWINTKLNSWSFINP